ncbi:hypothetical protein FRB95_000989 [Tulasnella sp. JGI-2019a]|nr:hypothetical protein FRB95_000989 [Tulasnella sp. JGI-2019a]
MLSSIVYRLSSIFLVVNLKGLPLTAIFCPTDLEVSCRMSLERHPVLIYGNTFPIPLPSMYCFRLRFALRVFGTAFGWDRPVKDGMVRIFNYMNESMGWSLRG